MMRLGAKCVVAVLAVALLHASACGPGARREPQAGGEWVRGPDSASEIDGDLDKAAERWRREISEQSWRKDAQTLALADDPAAEAASGEGTLEAGDEVAPPVPTTFWGRIKAGSDKVGKVGFAVMAVAVTIAVLVAPYLLL